MASIQDNYKAQAGFLALLMYIALVSSELVAHDSPIIKAGLSNEGLIIKYHVDSDAANSTYPLTIQFFKSDATVTREDINRAGYLHNRRF